MTLTDSIFRAGFTLAFATATISGCATSTQPVSTDAALAEPHIDRSGDIVIAADGDGVGTSWSSVTDSPLARTATELSNLGGAPIVLGAVGIIMAADAAPKRRAKRVAALLQDDLAPRGLDRRLANRLSDIMETADVADDAASVRIKAFERRDDLANEGYVVTTEYALARDGLAVRITADMVHSDVLALEEQIIRELNRIEMVSNHSGMGRSSRRLRQLQREWEALPPRYRGRVVYHSDPIGQPPIDALSPSDPDVLTTLRSALDAERAARQRLAERTYNDAISRATKPRHIAKAERRRNKALAKAEKFYSKGQDDLADDEIDKMEMLLLATTVWRDSMPDGQSVLSDRIGKGHAFIADVIGAALLDTGALADPDNPPRRFDGADLLRQDEDGRMVMRLTEGRQAGSIISVPDSGEADYGMAVAQP